MLRNLENGDIILLSSTETGNDPFRPQTHPELFTEQDEAQVIKMLQIKDRISHVMMHFDGKIIHSTNGQHQLGVRSHMLFDEKGMITSTEFPISRYVVLRCTDSILKENIAKAAFAWDACAPHNIQSLQKKVAENKHAGIQQKLKLFTPYTATGTRQVDNGTNEEIACKESYRAFRAYLRNKAKVPLTKNKGVNCNEFVAYCIKVAAVDALFPAGLPKQLTETIELIENTKKKSSYRKLSQIPKNLWDQFTDAVTNTMTYSADQVDVKASNKPKDPFHRLYLYSLVCMRTKSMDPAIFLRELMWHNTLWKMEGYLCFNADKIPAPKVISHTDCAALCTGISRRDNLIVEAKTLGPQ